ncbi:MAG: class I SAM-dependent methyltransferase [Planctomycetaceae bacterium]
MPGIFAEHAEFFRQYRCRFETTGAVAPSSRFLARALTGPLAHRQGPTRVLEVGPGTGAVTQRIVRLLKPGDQFDLVELNEAFAGLLERRFAVEPEFQRVADRARVHVRPIQTFQAEEPYDIIISGLPLNNFPAELVQDIFAVLLELLAPDGVLSYFEYMYMRSLRRLVSTSEGRRRLASLDGVLRERLARHRFRRDWVFINVPPAWVQHLRHAVADVPPRETAARPA